MAKKASSFVVPNSITTETNGAMKFKFRNINVSFVNAIRRTILCDIPTVVFKTTPFSMCQCEIFENTTRMNNELLKHRLSGIPIHMTNLDPEFLEKWYVEVNEENTTEDIMYVTTEHFKIHAKEEQKESDVLKRDEVFPINEISSQYMDLLILHPKLLESHQKVDKIHFRCSFSVGTAREDSNYNVVSNCYHTFSCDEEKAKEELKKLKESWKKEGMDKEEIEKEAQNWLLLDALRIVEMNAYDFFIKTIGVYSNEQIMFMACRILCSKLKQILKNETFTLEPSVSTMTNAFDIWLMNEDHTIGKMIEYCFYSSLYENAKQLHFVGFVKNHPHDSNCMIRIAYKRPIALSDVKTDFFKTVKDSMAVLKEVSKAFTDEEEIDLEEDDKPLKKQEETKMQEEIKTQEETKKQEAKK
jgi:DNA-directed RNA polymerase alpha subunit/DNA-directed RNA polymerase subunit L